MFYFNILCACVMIFKWKILSFVIVWVDFFFGGGELL